MVTATASEMLRGRRPQARVPGPDPS